MGFLSNLFGKDKISSTKPEEVEDRYAHFWNWFAAHSDTFYELLQNQEDIEEKFLNPLGEAVRPISEHIYFLVGMNNEGIGEVIFTSDGVVKAMPLIEDLVGQAPSVPRWSFIAHKQAFDVGCYGIKMGEYTFDGEKMQFFADEQPAYPDLISLKLVHEDYKAEDKKMLENGCMIFLDNFLGELAFTNQVDEIELVASADGKELIPITKLKDYLLWREKEFIEKYKGLRKDTEQDTYSGIEGTLNNGMGLVGIVNNTLMEWDAKASHPWLMRIDIGYKSDNEGGMPNQQDYQLMNELEDGVIERLRDQDGYLNVARQTADGLREIFFACKDFHLPVHVMEDVLQRYRESSLQVDYVLYRDKYWKSLEMFKTTG